MYQLKGCLRHYPNSKRLNNKDYHLQSNQHHSQTELLNFYPRDVKVKYLWTILERFFSYFSIKTCCGYSFKKPHHSTSYEYPQHVSKENWRKLSQSYHQTLIVNSFPTSGDFCSLLITFANSLDPDQACQFVGPDLGPNCLPP